MARRNRNRKRNNNARAQPAAGRARIRIRPAASTGQPRRAPRRRNRRRSSVLADIGGAVGGMFGPAVGRLGSRLGGGISRIFGSGDYVLSNTPRSNTLAGSSPPMFGSSTGATRIRHREFVSDIYSSTDFLVRSYALTPGIPQLFPWLSKIAQNYEQYRFMGIVVEFKSTSASALNSTNTALGVVGLATQYDANEPNFLSKQEAENYIGAQSTNPSQSLLHFVECAKGQNPLDNLYTRTGQLGTDQDIKFYDLGKVQLFTQGMQQADVTIGELWVSYDIQFLKPKLPSGIASAAPVDVYLNNSVGYNNIYLSGRIAGVRDNPNYGNLGTYLINDTIYFPTNLSRGRYIVYISAYLTGGSGAGATIITAMPTLTGCSAAPVFNLGSGVTPGTWLSGGPQSSNPQTCAFAVDLTSSTLATALMTHNLVGTGGANNLWAITIHVSAVPTPPATISRENIQEQFDAILRQMQRYNNVLAIINEDDLEEEKEIQVSKTPLKLTKAKKDKVREALRRKSPTTGTYDEITE